MLNSVNLESSIFRLIVFILLFILLAVIELYFPKRKLSISKTKRWFNNLSLTIFNTVVIRLCFPLTAVGFALLCQENEIGLFNLWQISSVLSVLFSILILDLIIWYQHYLFHKIPLLFRLHMVHHADKDLDLSSAARFHTVEMLLSLLIKLFAIALLGTPAIAVLWFEILLSSLAMFNHANISISHRIDNLLRLLVVTPDMHRVHHSVYYQENNNNFGFCLSIWDRIFSTYVAQPKDGHHKMNIGLNFISDENKATKLMSLLVLPFQSIKRQNSKQTNEEKGNSDNEKGDSHIS